MGESDPTRISARAYQVFGNYLASLSNGEAVQFEELCREHADIAPELVALYGRGSSPSAEAQSAIDAGSSQEPDYLEEALGRLGRARPFERYRREREVGRGGMGVVYQVWDEDLRRTLAMKVILDRHLQDEKEILRRATREGRFLDEAQVNGQLHHPSILPIYEVGLDDEDRLYFTMPLVKGRNLKQIFALIREGREDWSTTRALGVLLQVCDAVAYAHSKKVIHRDLKPSNIMIGKYGEVYVMDWGLARVAESEDRRDIRIRPRPDPTQTVIETERLAASDSEAETPLVTMDGDVIGTPSYMSPEQAGGKPEDMGPASDIYSIGAILYHLLSGHAPYIPEGMHPHPFVVLARIQESAPRPLEQLAPDTPAELLAVCRKAMKRNPEERYSSMVELADDLRAFLEHRVVRAYATGTFARINKWVRRNRKLAASAVIVLAGAAGGLWFANTLRARIELEQSIADGLRRLGATIATSTATDEGRTWSRELAGRLADAVERIEPERAAEANHMLGRCFAWLDEHERARYHLGRALDAFGQSDDTRQLAVVLDLARVHDALEDGAAADYYGRLAQEIETSSTAQQLRELSGVINLHDQATPFPEAEQLTELLRARRAELFGPDNSETVKSIIDLGAFHARRKDFDRAEGLFAQALEALEKSLPPTHADVLVTKVNLAATYCDNGKNLDAAQALLEEAVRLYDEHFAPDTPNALEACNILARVLLAQAEAKPSAELVQRALELALRANELSDFQETYWLATLARAYYESNDLEAAFRTQEEALRQLRGIAPGLPDYEEVVSKLADYQAALTASRKDLEATSPRQ